MIELSRRAFLSPRSYQPELETANTQIGTETLPVYENDKIDIEVSEAIEQFLGLTPKDVKCFIRPGNHVLDKNHIELITSEKINHVMGEISLGSLSHILLYDSDYTATFSLKLKNLLNRVLNPGIGAADREIEYHKEALKVLLENGYTISTADSNSEQLFVSKKKTPKLLAYSGIGILTALVGVSALATSKYKISRRKALGVIAGMSAALATVGVEEWLRALTIPSPIPLQRIPIFEKGNDLQIAIENTDAIGDDLDRSLGTFTELLIERRNEIMALNYWYNIAATSKAGTSQNRVLAFMGVGHGKAVDNFLEGPKSLETKVSNFANKILTDGLNSSMQAMLNDTTIDKSSHIFSGKVTILGWAEYFEDAVSIGKNIPEGLDDDSRMPSTARTVFIDALLEQLEKYSKIDSRSELDELKFQVLKSATTDIAQNMELTARRSIPAIREVVGIEHPIEYTKSISEQLRIVGMSEKINEAFTLGQGVMINDVLHFTDTQIVENHSDTKPHEVVIGFAKHRGRYSPITLRFSEDKHSGTLYASKQMKDVRGYEVAIGTLTYKKVTSGNELTLLGNSPYLRADITYEPNSWVDLYYRTDLTMVSAQTVPVFGFSDLYILDGEPPTLYDPKIISSRQI